ncbi:MAG TPA: aldose 1-epimerase [Solirubrobacteraceae bacterium]|nr:aldose 1-epimerase [Solirubrobacteraceae bacterium]
MRIVRLRSAGGELEAAFAPEAGLVGCSLTHRGDELLAQRKGLDEYARSGSTFGIPFLHPWANRLSGFAYAVGGNEVELDRDSELLRLEEHDLPIHGLRPNGLQWEVQERGDALSASVEFDGERLAGFPYPHRLAIDVTLADDGLTLETTLTPTSATSVPIAFGYHPYLRIPGAPRAEWEVDMPVECRLVADDDGIPTGEVVTPKFRHGVLEDHSLDDGYELPERPRPFTVSAAGRTLGVDFLEGYTHAQAFAPAGQDLICFEPMTAPANALISHDGLRLAAPGEPFSAAFRITVDG